MWLFGCMFMSHVSMAASEYCNVMFSAAGMHLGQLRKAVGQKEVHLSILSVESTHNVNTVIST